MSYIDLINAFERWLETNYLPVPSQLLWYKLIALFNRCAWAEWITVDNYRLMGIMQVQNEKTFIKIRDKLIDSGLFLYTKGKKGSPNRYKINTVNFTVEKTVKSTVEKTVESTVEETVESTDINRLRQDNYLLLYKKYISQKPDSKNFVEIIKFGKTVRQDSDFQNLNKFEQLDLCAKLGV